MKTLYLDVFSGISGDMFLGAMLDLGLPETTLSSELEKLGLDEYRLQINRQQKSNIEGVKFDVELLNLKDGHEHTHEHGHGHSHDHEALT